MPIRHNQSSSIHACTPLCMYSTLCKHYYRKVFPRCRFSLIKSTNILFELEALSSHIVKKPNKNLSVAATTGSGIRTAACIAILSRIDTSQNHPQAIYLVHNFESDRKVAVILAKGSAYTSERVRIRMTAVQAKT